MTTYDTRRDYDRLTNKRLELDSELHRLDSFLKSVQYTHLNKIERILLDLQFQTVKQYRRILIERESLMRTRILNEDRQQMEECRHE